MPTSPHPTKRPHFSHWPHSLPLCTRATALYHDRTSLIDSCSRPPFRLPSLFSASRLVRTTALAFGLVANIQSEPPKTSKTKLMPFAPKNLKSTESPAPTATKAGSLLHDHPCAPSAHRHYYCIHQPHPPRHSHEATAHTRRLALDRKTRTGLWHHRSIPDSRPHDDRVPLAPLSSTATTTTGQDLQDIADTTVATPIPNPTSTSTSIITPSTIPILPGDCCQQPAPWQRENSSRRSTSASRK